MSIAEKRSVHTDALETLGMIIDDDNAARDAIHLAVEPVVAAGTLFPGQDVALVGGLATAVPAGHPKALGIVDPFLRTRVYEGNRFWLVVYPRQITSLRHVWSHPGFSEAGAPEVVSKMSPERVGAEQWIREFVNRVGSRNVTYESLLEDANEGSGYLSSGDDDLNGEVTVPDEFWDNAEIVLGKRLIHRNNWFSCSC